MRLATFTTGGRVLAGVVSPAGLHPLDGTVLDLVRAGLPAALHAGKEALQNPAIGYDRLLAPLTPPTVRDFVAFEEHVEGVRRQIEGVGSVPAEWYEAPTFYFTNPYAIVGPYDDVPVPPGSQRFDFELEVAAVAGPDESIFGYTIMNDWSARDLQAREMKVSLGPAKGKDSATTLGPWLVTADEVEPFRDADGFLALDMRVAVNGVEVGQDLLSNMGWPFEELLAYAARGTQVRAGDVLGSGTCGNGGCLAELWGRRGRLDPPPLQPGDVVEMTVEALGTIRNRVVPGAEPPPLRAARPRPRKPEKTGMSDRSLHGKVVVVTGAAQGQGAAVARLLTESGATVIGCDVHGDCHRLDITDTAGWTALASALASKYGQVHGLVANAGITWRARLGDLDPADLARVAEVNVGGTLRGIRVNTVHPGYIETPMTASAVPAFRDANIAQTPLGRTGTVDDIAPLVRFLISDESAFITGAEIPVDGGLTAHGGVKSISEAVASSSL